MKIESLKPYFSDEDIEFILNEFRNILSGKGFLTMGPFGEKFESSFADYNNKKYAISCNSGTSAIEIICRALEVSGYEVILPTNTFIATANAVINAGGIPVFADICHDMSIDPEDVENKITNRTKAIITVHIGGYVSPSIYDLLEICKNKSLYLVEDAAQAHGTKLNEKKAGTFGVAGAFSFFPTKVMTTGEGGIVITDDDDIYKKGLSLRQFGKSKKGIYQNYSERLGYNWRMTEVSALMGLTQLKNLDSFIDRRTDIANIYNRRLSELEKIDLMKISDKVKHNWFKYILFLKYNDQEKVHLDLKNKYNLDLSGYVYEIPLHMQPCLKEYNLSDYPVAEKLCSTHICLPLFYSLKNTDAEYVIDSLISTLT